MACHKDFGMQATLSKGSASHAAVHIAFLVLPTVVSKHLRFITAQKVFISSPLPNLQSGVCL